MKRDPEVILSVCRDDMTPDPAALFGAPILAPPVPPVAFQLGSRTQALTPPPPIPGSPEEGPEFVEGVPPGSFA